MNFDNFNRIEWISYLAENKVINQGLLSEETQEAYDNFLLEEAIDEQERNLYHERLQNEVDSEIIRIAKEENDFENLEMYKIYANELNEIETIEEDEILNSEFDW